MIALALLMFLQASSSGKTPDVWALSRHVGNGNPILVESCSKPHVMVPVYSDSAATTRIANPFYVQKDHTFTVFLVDSCVWVSQDGNEFREYRKPVIPEADKASLYQLCRINHGTISQCEAESKLDSDTAVGEGFGTGATTYGPAWKITKGPRGMSAEVHVPEVEVPEPVTVIEPVTQPVLHCPEGWHVEVWHAARCYDCMTFNTEPPTPVKQNEPAGYGQYSLPMQITVSDDASSKEHPAKCVANPKVEAKR